MEPLKTWAVHSFLANSPGFNFSHIPLYDRLYSCSPFYSYISYFIFGLQTFFRNVFPGIWADPQQGERILNLFLRFPAILADLGIALIIFYVLKSKLRDENRAIYGSALYFWLPPLVFAGMRRPFVLPVSVLFLLAAAVLSEKRGWMRAVVTGFFLSLCFLTDLNPLLMWAVVLWIVVTYFIPGSCETQDSGRNYAMKKCRGQAPPAIQPETTSGSLEAFAPGGKICNADRQGAGAPCYQVGDRGKRMLEGLIVLIVMAAGLFLISAPFHNFTFKPPQPPVNISTMPDEVQEGLLQPLPSSDARFYPFAMIFGNQGRFYNSTSVSAFNIWALKGIGLPDNGYLFFVGKKSITPGMAGGIVSFIMIIILAVVLAMGKGKREGESQSQTDPAYFYFALVFFILFLFPTGGHDYLILAAFPFLILVFFSDIWARILFYGLTATCWVNLFFSDHLDLSPDAFTTVPAIIRLLSGANILLFLLGMIFFLMMGEEENLETDDRQDCLSYRHAPGDRQDCLSYRRAPNDGQECPSYRYGHCRGGAEKFEARLFEILPSLKDIRDWFAQPGNLQIALVLLVAFILRMWRLGTPGEVNFDEEYYVPMAGDYFYGLNDTVFEASHPPFATYIIGMGIGLLGDNVFGWRIMSVLFGVMQIGVLYLFAKKLFKNHIPALFAAFLLSFDFLHFVHSRLGMLDIFSSFFNLLSYYLFYLYLEDDGDYYLWVTGVSLALGAACKWTSLFTIGGIIVIIIGAWISSLIFKQKFPFADKLRSVNPLKVAAALLVIPFLFQILSFMPLLGTPGAAMDKIRDMMHYHENLAGKDEISSPWWSWLFVLDPVQYVQTEEGPPEVISESGTTVVNHGNRQIRVKSAVTGMGNPLVWWFTIPAFIICIILSYRERNPGGVYACMPFLFQYLPWAFVNRITYLFYMTDVVPYICLMVAFCLYKLFNTGRWGKAAVGVYLAGIAVSFSAFYPLLSAWLVRPEVYEKFRIFDFWNFQ